MKDNKITITIAGSTNTGKTTLACALQDFLKLRGFDVVTHDDEQDVDARPTNFNDACMEAVAYKTAIEIKTVHTRREAKPAPVKPGVRFKMITLNEDAYNEHEVWHAEVVDLNREYYPGAHHVIDMTECADRADLENHIKRVWPQAIVLD